MLFLSPSLRTRLVELMQELIDQGTDPVIAAKQILEVDPEHAASYCLLGTAASAEGDHQEARRLLWKSLELQPFGCMTYGALANEYRKDPETEGAGEILWVLALWAVGLNEEVPGEFAETFESDTDDPEIDFTDPDTFRLIAEEQETDLKLDVAPPELWERIRPYWLLKEVARGAVLGFRPELLKEVGAEASVCVPVWHAAVRAWAHSQGNTNEKALLAMVALLGEYGGPEILPDLWELSKLRDDGIFLHSHWAICRMAERFPGETIQSILAAIPDAETGLRCGMAEHLGLMEGAEGLVPAILALMKDFAERAKEDDASYLLVAAADALTETGHEARAKELFVQCERLLSKEGRRWIREEFEKPEGFIPRIVEEDLPGLDIEDVCVAGVLLADEDELEDEDEEDEDWDDDDEDTESDEAPAIKPGRNEPCWCGSGKKYKKCHLEADEAASREVDEEPDEPVDPARTEAMEGLLGTAERIHKRRDMIEASRQYFGDLREGQMESSEDFYIWYLFDFRAPATGRTAVEEHLRKNSAKISPEAQVVLEAWRDSRYGLFEVGSVQEEGVELKDLYAGDTLLVTDTAASHELQAGEYVLARIEERGEGMAFSADPLTISPEALAVLQKFVETEIKTTGQTPAEFVRANAHRLHRVGAGD